MSTGASDVPVQVSDFAIICRACMTRCSQPKSLLSVRSRLPGEDVPIESVVEELTAVPMRSDDGLPGQICSTCTVELLQFVDFIRKVRKSDRKLRQVFKSKTGSGVERKAEAELVLVAEEESEQVAGVEDNGGDVSMGEVEYLDVDQIDWKTVQEDTTLNATVEELCSNSVEQADGEPQELEFEVKSEGVDSDTEFNGFEDSVEEKPIAKKPQYKKHSKLPEVARSLMPTKMQGRWVRKNGKFTDKPKITEELDEVEQETYKIIERQPGEFLCCRCYIFFPSKAQRDAHAIAHTENQRINGAKKHACNICDRRYTSIASLKEHLQGAESPRVYECIRCRVRLVSKKRRWKHAHNHPQREMLANTIQTPIMLSSKSRSGIVCCADACRRIFPNELEMLAHAHEAHANKKIYYEGPEYSHLPYQCPVCFKRFNTPTGMAVHQKRKYRKAFAQCEICGASVSSSHGLAVHERTHRGERPFECDICSKGFTSDHNLKIHRRTHSTERPFVCSVCLMGFGTKATLKNHMGLHQGDRPYACTSCPKTFRFKYPLEMHMRTHTGEKPFPCRYCDKAFADHTNRHRHEMSHTGIKPYKCDECGKTFTTKRQLVEHAARH